MDINGYLNEIRDLAATGRATEHSYRPALERLFNPSSRSDHGADFADVKLPNSRKARFATSKPH